MHKFQQFLGEGYKRIGHILWVVKEMDFFGNTICFWIALLVCWWLVIPRGHFRYIESLIGILVSSLQVLWDQALWNVSFAYWGTERRIHYCCNLSFYFIFIFLWEKRKFQFFRLNKLFYMIWVCLWSRKLGPFVDAFHGHVKDRNAPYHALAFHHICLHHFLSVGLFFSPQLGVDGLWII